MPTKRCFWFVVYQELRSDDVDLASNAYRAAPLCYELRLPFSFKLVERGALVSIGESSVQLRVVQDASRFVFVRRRVVVVGSKSKLSPEIDRRVLGNVFRQQCLQRHNTFESGWVLWHAHHIPY